MKTMSVIHCLTFTVLFSGCETLHSKPAGNSRPHAGEAVSEMAADDFQVDQPERFPIATAGEYTTSELNVAGVVTPDVSRQVPVPSPSTGRVIEVDVHPGEVVKKGQLLFRVRSTDIFRALSEYRKAIRNEQLAVENEKLAKIQLERARFLYDRGAVPKSAVEVADNAEAGTLTDLDNARVDVSSATDRLQFLGADPNRPTEVVDVYAPASGVITDQQITAAAAVQAMTPPHPFTISDLSRLWLVCDVYQDDVNRLHVGKYADIHPNAYPDRILRGRIANILLIPGSKIRTAKVRLDVENPESLIRFGMFVVATFHEATTEKHATLPSTAILPLHNREWAYIRGENGYIRRVEVVSGSILPNKMLEVVSGIEPGDRVIANALAFQNMLGQISPSH